MAAFHVHDDAFNGAIVSPTTADLSSDDIQVMLQALIAVNKALVWVTLNRDQAALVPLFVAQGFVFHLCNEHELTLICRLQANAYAPFAPTHTLGVGGLVLNDNGEVLLVRDKWMQGKGLKLPGGYVDLGESFDTAAEREVFEETGIKASFNSIVSVVNKHPHSFAKSNAYIVCRLSPNSHTINIQDTDEIELAQWVSPALFLSDEHSSAFHRHLVATLINKQGLAVDPFHFNDPTSRKRMYSAN